MKVSQCLAVVFFLLFFSSCSLFEEDLSKKEDIAQPDDGIGLKDKTVSIAAEGGGELRLTKKTFSSEIEIAVEVLKKDELLRLYDEIGFELELGQDVVLLDPVRFTLGAEGDDAFSLDEPLIYALPASALPASQAPKDGWSAALPAAALPASMKYLKEETQIFAIATLFDPEGKPYGTPFNTLLSFEDDSLLAIVTPEMLAATAIKGGSTLVISLFVVPAGSKATFNQIDITDYAYGQQKLEPIEIMAVRGNGSGDDVFRNALIVEVNRFDEDGQIVLTADDETKISLGFTIDRFGQVIATLPDDLVPGSYQLKLMSESGSATTEVEILRGEPGIGITWLGSFTEAPADPSENDAYYDSKEGVSYIFAGEDWEILSRDGMAGEAGSAGVKGAPGNPGISILWQGTWTVDPPNPQLNWAYYNSDKRTSYIYDGVVWKILAKDGTDGAGGGGGGSTVTLPLVWKGSLGAAPLSPQTNWAYYDNNQKKTFLFTGENWQVIAESIVGPEGPQGVQGDAGAIGPLGPMGVSGRSGITLLWQGTLSSAPSSPEIYYAYKNSTDDTIYYYDGSTWQGLNQAGGGIVGGGGGTIEISTYPTVLFGSTENYRYQVGAQSAESSDLYYHLLVKPQGMTVGEASGEIYWQPQSGLIGSFEVVLIVADDKGGVAAQAFTLTRTDASPPSFAGLSSAVALNASEIYLSWGRAYDSEAGTISYKIYQAGEGQTMSYTTALATVGSTAYTVTGLAEATSYAFAVRACDDMGNCETNQVVKTATTKLSVANDTTAPTFGGAVRVIAKSSSSIEVFWAPAADEVSPRQYLRYLIYVSTTSAGEDFAQATVVAPEAAVSQIVDGLSPAQVYYVVVRAIDEAGNEDGNTVEVTTTTPAVAADWQIDYPPFYGQLSGVFANSSSDIWAVGGNAIIHGDGTNFSIVKTYGQRDLTKFKDIWGSAGNDIWVAGVEGRGNCNLQSSGSSYYNSCSTWLTFTLHYDGVNWSRFELPASFTLNSEPQIKLQGNDPSRLFLVTSPQYGEVYHWSGSGWLNLGRPSTDNNDYYKVALWDSGTSLYLIFNRTNDCRYSGGGRVYSHDGTAWTSQLSTSACLNYLDASSENDIWVVGYNGTVYHYDGTAWQLINLASTANFSTVRTYGPSDVTICCDSNGRYRHFDGTDWIVTNTDPTLVQHPQQERVYTDGRRIDQLYSSMCPVYGDDVSDVTDSSDSSDTPTEQNIIREEPCYETETLWEISPNDIVDLWVGSDDFAWALPAQQGWGLYYATLLKRDGAAWAVDPSIREMSVTGSSYNHTFRVTSSGCYSYGAIAADPNTGDVIVLTYNNDRYYDYRYYSSYRGSYDTALDSYTWTANNSYLPKPTSLYLSTEGLGTWTASCTDEYYCDRSSSSYHGIFSSDVIDEVVDVTDTSDSSDYSSSEINFNRDYSPQDEVFDIDGSLAAGIWAVGRGGSAYFNPDGLSEFSEVPSAADLDLCTVAASPEGMVYAAGLNGTLLSYDGLYWHILNSGTTQTINALWASSDSDVYAVGSGGLILHYDGSSWTKMTSPAGSRDLFQVYGAGPDLIYIGGAEGTILRLSK